MSQGMAGSHCQGVGCSDVEVVPSTATNDVWLEQKVLLFFRLWHMIFLCAGGLLTLIIFLCCCFKCRIPRTKQEIESDFRRRKVTRKFRRELNKMQMEEIDIKDIRTVLDKVRDKFSRKYSLNRDGEEITRFAAFKLRVMAMLNITPAPKKDKKTEDENGEEVKEGDTEDEIHVTEDEETIGV